MQMSKMRNSLKTKEKKKKWKEKKKEAQLNCFGGRGILTSWWATQLLKFLYHVSHSIWKLHEMNQKLQQEQKENPCH